MRLTLEDGLMAYTTPADETYAAFKLLICLS